MHVRAHGEACTVSRAMSVGPPRFPFDRKIHREPSRRLNPSLPSDGFERLPRFSSEHKTHRETSKETRTHRAWRCTRSGVFRSVHGASQTPRAGLLLKDDPLFVPFCFRSPRETRGGSGERSRTIHACTVVAYRRGIGYKETPAIYDRSTTLHVRKEHAATMEADRFGRAALAV